MPKQKGKARTLEKKSYSYNSTNVVLVTTTFYPDLDGADSVRWNLATQMIGSAAALGYRVVVVDGTPGETGKFIRRRLGMLPNVVIERQLERGMGASRRQAFEIAYNFTLHDDEESYFMWLEPEKTDMIRHIPAMIAAMKEQSLDVLVPTRRLVELVTTYPRFQVQSERDANAVFAEVTGHELDIMGGVVVATHDLIQTFAACNPKVSWGAADGYIQHFALMQAIAQGCRAGSIEVPFCYPSSQMVEEETGAIQAMLERRRSQFEVLTRDYRVVGKALGLLK